MCRVNYILRDCISNGRFFSFQYCNAIKIKRDRHMLQNNKVKNLLKTCKTCRTLSSIKVVEYSIFVICLHTYRKEATSGNWVVFLYYLKLKKNCYDEVKMREPWLWSLRTPATFATSLDLVVEWVLNLLPICSVEATKHFMHTCYLTDDVSL